MSSVLNSKFIDFQIYAKRDSLVITIIACRMTRKLNPINERFNGTSFNLNEEMQRSNFVYRQPSILNILYFLALCYLGENDKIAGEQPMFKTAEKLTAC